MRCGRMTGTPITSWELSTIVGQVPASHRGLPACAANYAGQCRSAIQISGRRISIRAARRICLSAEDALKRSIALSPGYPAYANLGMLYMQEKRYAEAATATEQAVKINGNDYMVWNNLMIAYEGAKQSDKAESARHKAEELAENVAQLKPRDAVAQSTLANLYASDKLDDKALARIRTSLALRPMIRMCCRRWERRTNSWGIERTHWSISRSRHEGLRARRHSQRLRACRH